MRFGVFVVIAALGAAAAADARAEGTPTATGFELGLRAGYTLPMGGVIGAGSQTVGTTTVNQPAEDLGDLVTGGVPLTLDAGYRVTPHVYVGAFATYGFLFINTDKNPTCTQNGVSCSGHDIQVGANVHYHILPDQTFDPWVGAGVGYEWMTLTTSQSSISVSETLNGFQFANVQLGADYKATPNFGIGPFATFNVGQYSSASSGSTSIDITNTALHEWLTFGLRGVYDVNL